jgi:D-alanyl-lipoteichoic acid acyltransferase DltB (MBOAT superfamily)
VIVANYISTDFVDGVFRTPADYSSLDVLLGAYAYAIQIYCDFSAYTDIAIGVANLLGYEFPQNFNQPYSACTLQDFWRRWHITLSNWLRDYLYIPLGGNRYGGFITIRNIIITMGLGGLWHGASLNFVIWGLLHGFGLSVERVLGVTRPSHAPGRPFAVRLVGWALTFHFVCFAWVFFRCPNLDAAGIYLQSLYSGTNWTTTTMTPLVMVLMVCGTFTQMIPPRWVKSLQYSYEFAPLALKIAIPAGVIFLISVASPEGVPPFIYFQF